jgi:photosystem II stability/assembly factor-like uncharacterized protein
MRIKLAVLCVALSAFAFGCKKTGTGTGGGGGGWLVGKAGLMSNVDPHGQIGTGYDLGASDTLNGIACRFSGEAWVVGDKGTLLYTNDAGVSWSAQVTPATGDLRALATQDAGPVFVAGDNTFMMSTDTGAHWTELGNGTTSFRSVAAAQEGSTVLALGTDGSVWSFDGTNLNKVTTIVGAHAIAVSADGQTAMIAGNGLLRSLDAGHTWTALAVSPSIHFEDVNLDEDGDAVAVGAKGALANVDADGTVVVQHVGTADLHTLHVADAADADAIGYTAGEDGQVYMSTDAGRSWFAGPNVGRAVYGIDQIGAGHR